MWKVHPGGATSDVHVSAAQDLWQYHAVISVARAHSAAMPGQTFVGQFVFDAGKNQTPHAADVSTTFGIQGQFDAFPKGKFEGFAAVNQAIYGAFARTGDPSCDEAPFAPFDATEPKMTIIDGPGASTVVSTKAVCDEIYGGLVAKIRAAEV